MARYIQGRFTETQAQRDKALIGRCVDGLGLYAAQIAENNKFSPKINEMRELAENLIGYWGLYDSEGDESPAKLLQTFNDRVDEAKTGGAITGDVYQTAPNVIYGLYRYGEDMVTSMGRVAMNDILETSNLMKEIANHWDFDSDALDGLTVQLESEVRYLLGINPLPGQPVSDVINAGYVVTQAVLFDNDRGFALAHSPTSPSPFVTWQLTNDNGAIDYYWGRYHDSEEKAKIDYVVRAVEHQEQYGLKVKPLILTIDKISMVQTGVTKPDDFLTVERYPVLAELNKKLTDFVDIIAEQGGAGSPDGRGVVDLQRWEQLYGFDLMSNGALLNTALDMLNERPEIRDWELDKNELIVYRALDAKELDTKESVTTAASLSDPSVTLTDMYAYGYSWDGMIPLGKERALELFDKNHEVLRLFENNTESIVESREEIESFDGLFGTEDPAWVNPEQEPPFQVFIVNPESYGKGEVSGEWLTLPTDADTLRELLERIGIHRPSGAAFNSGAVDRPINGTFAVTALRMPIEEHLREYISKYNRLDELNMLASRTSGMDEYELDKLRTILSCSDVNLGGNDIGTVINLVNRNNFSAFDFIYADNEDELGRWYTDERNEKPDGVSYAEYGKQCAKIEGGVFINDGYLRHMRDEIAIVYDGAVPDEHRIVGKALRGLQPQKPERGSERSSGEKPSVIAQIRAARQASYEPKDKPVDVDAQKHTKRKGGPEL
ncbi:MAG: antirestriction protein ArdA [Defluviitaleaceae bacterium]|nr:antirestriction protein ArdA [Defluviitaleaceae bacterium]